MMTEDEAYLKWCPFARAVYLGEEASPPDYYGTHEIMVPHNRVYPHDDGISAVLGQGTQGPYCACVASGCMAWRWHDHDKENDARLGYCGLAGSPLART